jgi:hypothetical protein
MSFLGGLAKIGVGFATGGIPGAAVAGASMLAGGGAAGSKADAAAVEQAALQEEVDNARKRLANKQVTNVTDRVAALTQ